MRDANDQLESGCITLGGAQIKRTNCKCESVRRMTIRLNEDTLNLLAFSVIFVVAIFDCVRDPVEPFDVVAEP